MRTWNSSAPATETFPPNAASPVRLSRSSLQKHCEQLKAAGVTRYHNNLETSRRNFPNICTTHTYDDKIQTIKWAMEAGLEVCSGGIMGLGETWEDRIDMYMDIASLGIKSVPSTS